MALPPIGFLDAAGEAELIADLTHRVSEAVRQRRPWDDFTQQNRNLYETGTVHGTPADDEMIVHEIQVHVISSVVVQMREPPRPKLEPVETGEPPTYFWAGPQDAGIMLGVPPECVAESVDPAGNRVPPQPLPEQLGEALFFSAVSKEQAFAQQQQQQAMAQQAAATGLQMLQPPPIVREDWIVAKDDRLVADVYQTVLNTLWRRSKVDQWIKQNLLNTNIDGTALGLFEFDKPTVKFILKHLPFKQVYLDPLAADVKDATYAGFDLVYDADEARASFPTLKETIDFEAHTGPPRPLGADATWSGQQNIDFEREIIEFRVFWMRNQVAFLSEREAVESGAVIAQEVPDASQGPITPGVSQPPIQEGEAVQAGDEVLAPEQAAESADSLDPVAGVDAGGVRLPPVPVRTVYLLPDTGEEVTPPTPETWRESRWPTKPAVRQVVVIGNRIVENSVSGFGGDGIPILHNLNIPTGGSSPYGIGEPYRLRNLQRAMSGTIGAMVENAAYHAHPITVISEGMAEILPDDVKRSGHARPGLMLKVPDDQFVQFQGQINAVQQPPAMPPALGELYPLLKGTIDQLSGNTPTMRGNAPSANASGKMVEMLQSAGADMMWARGSRTADMVERMVELMLHEIVFGLSVEDVRKIVSKYPPHVLAAIHERAREIEWNVIPGIEAGTGPLKMQKRQTAQMDRQIGALSLDGYSEAVGIDRRKEKPRLEKEMEEAAQAAAAMAPQQPGGGDGQRDKPAA